MNPTVRKPWLRISALITLIAVSGCASSTLIQSNPPGARLFVDGAPVGVTPYQITDTKIVGSTTTLRLEMPGYEVTNAMLVRNEEFDVGACIGGVFVLIPFLWIMGYRPVHMIEMRPLGASPAYGYPMPAQPGYPPAQPGYPGAQPGYPPPAQPGYPPPAQPGYQQPGYPPPAQPAPAPYAPPPAQR